MIRSDQARRRTPGALMQLEVCLRILGVGRIGFWKGGSLWIGHGLSATEIHAHHAIQLCFGLDRPIRLQASTTGEWASFRAVLIPSMASHALDASGSLSAALFCEPHSEIGRGLIARFGLGGFAALPEPEVLAEQLRAIGEEMAQGNDPRTACQRLLARLAGTGLPQATTDVRVLRATDFIAANLGTPIKLADAAAAVALSPGRFRHLFVAEMGLPFRTYVLWLRLQLALQAGLCGTSWTEAAHASGFSDSAHLSRTFRKMMGIAPTAIPRPAGR